MEQNLIQRAIILEDTDTVREEHSKGLISNNTAKAGNGSTWGERQNRGN